MKLILFGVLIIGGFMVMGADAQIIQDTFRNILFFCAAMLVAIFGLKIFIEAIKG